SPRRRPSAWPSCGSVCSQPPACAGPASTCSAASPAPEVRCMMDLSVVIPVKDERDNVRPLHEQLRQALDPLGLAYEVIVVDDGSTDGTGAVLQELASGDPRLKVVQLRRNYGQTAALQAGIDWSG